jgi:hypothetical protein
MITQTSFSKRYEKGCEGFCFKFFSVSEDKLCSATKRLTYHVNSGRPEALQSNVPLSSHFVASDQAVLK